ncbi:regulator of telomere elongation helicase 1-like isoform X1, partial [Leptotrombidium deliense]
MKTSSHPQLRDVTSLDEKPDVKAVDESLKKTLTTIQLCGVTELKKILYDIKQELDTLIFSVTDEKVFLQENTLYEILAKSNFDYSLLGVIDNVITYLVERLDVTLTTTIISIAINALLKLEHFLRTVYPDDVVYTDGDDGNDILNLDFLKNFKVFAVKYENTKSSNTKCSKKWVNKSDKRQSWTLNVICLTPKVAMQSLMNCGIRSCIITSGTLAPLNSFEAELGVPFKVTLQNSHIIDSSNLKVFTIVRGKDNE